MATEKLIHPHCARIGSEAKRTSQNQVVESLARCPQVAGLHLAGREKGDCSVASGVSCTGGRNGW